jgi:hypothetical protein
VLHAFAWSSHRASHPHPPFIGLGTGSHTPCESSQNYCGVASLEAKPHHRLLLIVSSTLHITNSAITSSRHLDDLLTEGQTATRQQAAGSRIPCILKHHNRPKCGRIDPIEPHGTAERSLSSLSTWLAKRDSLAQRSTPRRPEIKSRDRDSSPRRSQQQPTLLRPRSPKRYRKTQASKATSIQQTRSPGAFSGLHRRSSSLVHTSPGSL